MKWTVESFPSVGSSFLWYAIFWVISDPDPDPDADPDPDPDPDPDLDHPNGTQPIIHIFRQGQKRSSQGIFLELSFSSNSTFAVSRKQTEQAIWQLWT